MDCTLCRKSGAKCFNLQSLTVGTTEHEDVSRMTICVTSDDITFEQIKKQLNCMVEVIKVIDLTHVPLHMKEILYAKVKGLDNEGKEEVFRIALTDHRNDDLITLLKKQFKSKVEIVRGGAVAIEAISTSCR